MLKLFSDIVNSIEFFTNILREKIIVLRTICNCITQSYSKDYDKI